MRINEQHNELQYEIFLFDIIIISIYFEQWEWKYSVDNEDTLFIVNL